MQRLCNISCLLSALCSYFHFDVALRCHVAVTTPFYFPRKDWLTIKPMKWSRSMCRYKVKKDCHCLSALSVPSQLSSGKKHLRRHTSLITYILFSVVSVEFVCLSLWWLQKEKCNICYCALILWEPRLRLEATAAQDLRSFKYFIWN